MATFNNFQEEGRKCYQPRNNSWSHPNTLIYSPSPENVGLDINRNGKSNSLKNKLFCIKKPLEEDANNFLNANSSSASKSNCDNDPSSSSRNRNSFHQDVEEALNSLLWQPYEYQNKPPTSSCSSCSSMTSSDLDDSPNKGPSFQGTDLNLRTEMVNNLKPQSSQLQCSTHSRDPLSCCATSRLSEASLAEFLDGGTARASASDVSPQNSDMQLEVTSPDGTTTTNVLSIPTGNDALISTVGNLLSTANVVGLPFNHPRNGSEPSQSRGPPISHFRSASVPKDPPTNISNINVNFYRAVPVNVVSSVPTIHCLNTLDAGNNVSNVQIMPLGGVTVHNPSTVQVRSPPRTFTSTEAQTDDPPAVPDREQRRKERRERRHQRRTNGTNHRHTVDSGTQANTLQNDRLPDLLNSHMPPPYSPLPSNVPPPNVVLQSPMMVPPPHIQSVVPNNVVPSGLVAFPPPQVVGGQVPLVQGNGPVAVPVPPPSGFRFPFPAGGFRRGRFSEEPPKGCCGLLAWKPGSLRWFIAVIALVAVCCVLVGTALGAMRSAGRDHLTVSLLMIGVGIVLVTVSGVAWRLTSHDSSTCRSMLGLGSTESVDVCTRRFVPRLPPSYGRPHHPYAAMMYPEFQYRPPPPSYQASMQEYRLRLLLLDRGNTPQIQAGIQNAVSPPPTYRSHAGSLLRAPLSSRRDTAQSEYSCPPSYRSQTSTNRPGTLQNSVLHSREQSLSLSESNHEETVNVVNILGSTEEDMALDNITLDSLKMEPESDINPLKMLLKGSSSDLEGSKDGNLVTIVQTSDQSPVIVTVSGSSQLEGNTLQITEIPSEMEILAHL